VRAVSTVVWTETELSGWGRYPRARVRCARPERQAEARAALAERDGAPVVAYGLGRSYGDAALNAGGRVVLTRRLDRMLEFDPATGWLRCEAGVSVDEVLATFVPRGFFPPVTPGTRFVTLGGALACNVHGKNHHVDGCFGDHVRAVELLTASGDVVVCDREREPELFAATVGGVGLTGLVLALEVRLTPISSPWIEMESVRVETLDHFFEVSRESAVFTHTVGWIDCLATGRAMGRGVFMRGRHAAPDVHGTGRAHAVMAGLLKAAEPLLSLPVEAPPWLLGHASVAAFNEAYFRGHPRGTRRSLVHFEPFFYPLDGVPAWNRLYGRRGFLQYQCVVPPDPERRAIRRILELISASGMASFLAVIKEFGEIQHGGLSFPVPGVTLALDFPNHGARLYELLDRLDDVVVDVGGRVYLGKDARLTRERFRRMYPRWEEWKVVRDRWDPHGVFQSDLGRRLGLVGRSGA
jgi:FAD/FMN-containing dehydrogenase